jgi:hypothetical protein
MINTLKLNAMSLHYISDNLGNKTAVVIPINQWQKIHQKFEGIANEISVSEEELTPAAFNQWITNAEQSADLTLEEFKDKWKEKKATLKNHILKC